MLDRTALCTRVCKIASQYNITMVTVHSIIKTFISYCKSQVIKGIKVDIFGLVTLVPNVITDNYTATLAYECEKIADILGLPHNTVLVIIQEYIDSLIDEILSGRTVELRGLATISPLYENGELVKVHSNISTSIKEQLKNNTTPVTSIRLSTHKFLKYSVKAKTKMI